MSANTLLLIQTILMFLQMVNAGIGTTVKDPLVSVILSAAVAAGQFYIQHLGNQLPPSPKDVKMP